MWEQYGMRAWMAAFLTMSFVGVGYGKNEAAGWGASMTAIIVAAGGLSTWMAGALSDRIGRTRTATVIMLISAAFSLSFGWMAGFSPTVLVILGLLYSFFVVAETPILSTGLTELAAPQSLGAAMGFQTLIGFLAATASPTIFGWVLDWTNTVESSPTQWGWAFTILGVGALVGPVVLTIVRRLPGSQKMAGGKC